MLKQLKKFLNPEESQMMAPAEEKEQLAAIELAAPIMAADDIVAQFAAYKEQLATSDTTFKTMLAQYEEVKKELEALKAEKQLAAVEAKKIKMEVRGKQLSSIIGDTKAPALLAATEDMDDVKFDAIVEAMSMSVTAEAKSEMFSEKGVDVKADASKVAEDDESSIMKTLKAQYGAKAR